MGSVALMMASQMWLTLTLEWASYLSVLQMCMPQSGRALHLRLLKSIGFME